MVCISDHQRNTLFRTADGGLNWEKLAESSTSSVKPGTSGWMPVISYPYVLSFIDQKHGWITGNSSSENPKDIGRLYMTSDSGETWRKVEPKGIQALFQNPQFIDGKTGFILADHFGSIDGPALFRTQDGGKTWTQILPFLYPRQTSYLDSMNGFGVDGYAGVRQVYRTSNGGRTWQKIGELPDGVEAARQIQFLDSMRGFELSQECDSLSCSNFGVYYTIDGGYTWHRFDQLNGFESRALAMVNSQEGYWIPFGNGSLLQISLNGIEAKKGAEPVLSEQSNFQFLNLQVGYELTHDQLFKTSNGAKTWQPLLPVCANRNRFLSLGRDGSLWVLGYKCSDYSHCITLLLSSMDGGQSWKSVILPTLTITDIQFADANHGWIRGGNKANYIGGITFGANHIYSTADGGRTWVQLN